jgi:hypothetical protein
MIKSYFPSLRYMQKIALVYATVVFLTLALGFLTVCLYARPFETLQVTSLIAGALILFGSRILPALERAIHITHGHG